MAKYTDKKTGKELVTTTPSEFKALIDASSDDFVILADGTRLERADIAAVPGRLKQNGDQGKFVDLTKVQTGSMFRDTTRGVVYVPFKKQDYQDGLLAEAQRQFGTQAFNQVSASFTEKFKTVNPDTLFTYAVEEFYSADENFVIGSVTASAPNCFSPEGSASFSGIANDSENGYTLTLDFSNSSNATALSLRSPGGSDLLHSIFIPSFPHKFINTSTISHSIGLTTSSLTGVGTIAFPTNSIAQSPASGAACLSSLDRNVNGVNPSSGQYRVFFTKGRVSGDADSGSLYDFLSNTPEIVIYRSDVTVASGSFRYQPSPPGAFVSTAAFALATTSSSDIRTLYYISGANNGPSGSHTGSGVMTGGDARQASQLGSLVHGDPLLRTTASYGFYSPVGPSSDAETQKIYRIHTSSIDNGGSSLSSFNAAMKVPRFIDIFS